MDLLTPDLGVIFWQTVTVLFAVFILGKFAWKPLLKAIEAREKDVTSALEKANEARQFVSSIEKKKNETLDKAVIDGNKIILDAQKESEKIIDSAKSEANKIINMALEQSKNEIEKEKKAAIKTINKEITSLSVKIAEQLIKDHLKDDGDQNILIKNMLK